MQTIPSLKPFLLVGVLAGIGACSGDGPLPAECDPNLPNDPNCEGITPDFTCSIDVDDIFVGAFRDAIPALTNPTIAPVGQEGTNLWIDSDRVLGLIIDGQPIAIPLGIFWWHENVNLEFGGETLAITYCPLTGSNTVFDREPFGGVEFGISGLLFKNNLLLYDRDPSGNVSFWPQMALGARCGPKDGTDYAEHMLASMEIDWGGWRRIHPNTLVASPNTGFDRDYTRTGYPYGRYDTPSNPELLFPLPNPIDTRHPPKMVTLGVPNGDGTRTAFTYGNLSTLGETGVVTMGADEVAEPYIVLWDGEWRGAMAYRPRTESGIEVTMEVVDGRWRDVETGSTWNLTGQATGGELAGEQLEPVHQAFVAFWFAWPAFYPDIVSWSP